MPEEKELVLNTTPIISSIAATGSLYTLTLLYSLVWVPFEVCREIYAGGADNFAVTEFEQMNWLHKQNTQMQQRGIWLGNSVIEFALREAGE